MLYYYGKIKRLKMQMILNVKMESGKLTFGLTIVYIS